MFLRSGFSLIELMVTIALVSILLTVGVPSFGSILRSMTLTTQANNFVASINFARSEAIRRNSVVILSAAASNLTQNHWESGWQVWIDSNGNGTLDNGELLRLFPDIGAGSLVSNTSLVRFSGSGFLDGRSPSALVFSLQPPGCAREASRDITVTPAGRPSITETTCI
ncbi:type IVa pilus pseudopilin TppE [Aeromonas jandaei]|uniref:type IVa pilus pseudopilin TppE n=1 Tax=Aeromonas jandaei TaxID=650 RepID=UPI00191FDE06|nr:type IVa pilus pseudopilin TppE [Aeromonas jandaei]MBL0626936.1 type IVa pilus pseudopilin TppE [Aeromonas jandaei]WAG09483.1 type IVa pilus pseudopilin TppE [Aeromonas jandaei]